MNENGIGVAIESAFTLLRVPAVLALAPGGVLLQGNSLIVPCVSIINQDGRSRPTSNLQGEELATSIYLSIVAVVPSGDLETAIPIDREIRRRLLNRNVVAPLSTPRGILHSVTLEGERSYTFEDKGGSGMLQAYGAVYLFRVQGNEI